MRKAYTVANLIWLTLSAAVCAESVRLKVGTLHAPGPAFLPFYAGMLLGVLALISLVQTWKDREESTESVWAGTSLLKLGLLLAALFVYVALLQVLGFLLGTFLLLFFLYRIVEPMRWRTVFFASALTIGATYFLFGVLIESQLPKGVFGF
jgi:putative tricarboxylic transport membrane protein